MQIEELTKSSNFGIIEKAIMPPHGGSYARGR